MKLKELFEQQSEIVFKTDNMDEYNAFLNKQASDPDQYHFEEISPKGSDELFDIIVKVNDYSYAQQTRMDPSSYDIDWNVELYGTGDWNTETGFYFKKGEFPLSAETEENIEQHIMENQQGSSNDEPDFDDAPYDNEPDMYSRHGE